CLLGEQLWTRRYGPPSVSWGGIGLNPQSKLAAISPIIFLPDSCVGRVFRVFFLAQGSSRGEIMYFHIIAHNLEILAATA
ncbi:hypothetical protein P3E18_09440, partial [Pseudomonas aeruginosa]